MRGTSVPSGKGNTKAWDSRGLVFAELTARVHAPGQEVDTAPGLLSAARWASLSVCVAVGKASGGPTVGTGFQTLLQSTSCPENRRPCGHPGPHWKHFQGTQGAGARLETRDRRPGRMLAEHTASESNCSM